MCEKVKNLSADSMEPNEFYVCENVSFFVTLFMRDFFGLVNSIEGTITKWFQYVRKMNSFKIWMSNVLILW